MFGLFWVTALGLMTLYFTGMLDERRNPNQELRLVNSADGATGVVLERNVMGHYLANGEINGQPVVFLLDTGATNIGIPAAVASRLGLTSGTPSRSLTAGGIVSTWLVTLDQVRLGPIERGEVTASVIPDMPGEEVLLGMSFLRDLEIVQKGDTMTLRLALAGPR
ncbi:TIGR02281 family clan AA aspartic protease [Halieaceae bacterium IMCC14734]|uniref:TIGR02281 family clan AA aspartic protease n=2 Tax=Candidatus Litorirhabdus singularis TaxID=2518993 RepID=A0ABT3TJZ0_9GAMM|nr:TIGR02281 family clan AA aspartic protease [Candidatus Litorirhabdus singularis]